MQVGMDNHFTCVCVHQTNFVPEAEQGFLFTDLCTQHMAPIYMKCLFRYLCFAEKLN
jgi:hypothetical protein